jgi:hypothetical protein
MTSTYFDNHPDAPKGLYCTACGRMADHSGRELLEFTVYGWPKCCSEDMVFQAADEFAGPVEVGLTSVSES